MKNRKNLKHPTQPPHFKGELVDEKDQVDFEPTGRYMRKNPHKTPPNNLTTKSKWWWADKKVCPYIIILDIRL